MVSKTRTYQVKKNPKTDSAKAQWSDSQKFEAVTTYLMVGKWPIVSDATGIPIDTLKKWKQQDWWEDLEREVRRSSNIETSGKLKRIVDKAASVVEDRLENGDLIYNPSTNSFTRRPIGAKIASEILVKSIDRELLLQKLQDQPVLKEEAILDRLKNIESALIRASSKRKIPNAQIIDVTPVIHTPDLLTRSGSQLHPVSTTGGYDDSHGGSGPDESSTQDVQRDHGEAERTGEGHLSSDGTSCTSGDDSSWGNQPELESSTEQSDNRLEL